jgi:hypothetical protein
MPLLSTFGGASVRSLGRGTGVDEALVPAGTIVPWGVDDANTTPAPNGWTVYTGFNGRYVVGTANNAEIGTFGNTSANIQAVVSYTTSTTGNHLGTAVVAGPSEGSNNAFTFYATTSTYGDHSHSGTAIANVATLIPDRVTVPFITTTTERSVLPANAIVFRKVAPSSVIYDHYRPAGDGYFTGSSQQGWVEQSLSVASTSSSDGLHEHKFVSKQIATTGATTNSQLSSAVGGHTHSIMMTLKAMLKARALKSWISTSEEPIEAGMIVMYIGNLSELPAGWRVCNGQLGTENMVDYFLGYKSSEIHGEIINTSNRITYSNATVSTNSWTHNHISGTQPNPSFSTKHHASQSFAHIHTIANGIAGVTESYMPPWRKVAFIQYKGI